MWILLSNFALDFALKPSQCPPCLQGDSVGALFSIVPGELKERAILLVQLTFIATQTNLHVLYRLKVKECDNDDVDLEL